MHWPPPSTTRPPPQRAGLPTRRRRRAWLRTGLLTPAPAPLRLGPVRSAVEACWPRRGSARISHRVPLGCLPHPDGRPRRWCTQAVSPLCALEDRVDMVTGSFGSRSFRAPGRTCWCCAPEALPSSPPPCPSRGTPLAPRSPTPSRRRAPERLTATLTVAGPVHLASLHFTLLHPQWSRHLLRRPSPSAPEDPGRLWSS
jgi:hypothetical protein